MTATRTPFANRPAKPQVVRMHDRRVAIFMGAAYQFTDDAGAPSLRDQLDLVLRASPREVYDEAERQARAQAHAAAADNEIVARTTLDRITEREAIAA